MNYKDLKELIYLTPKERRSVTILLVAFALLLVTRIWVGSYYKGKATISKDKVYDLLERYHTPLQSDPSIATATLIDFDPNSIGIDQLIQSGWPEYPAKSLINYRQKGGVFKVKSDLEKIYGIDEAFYQLIYDHIMLPDELEINNSRAEVISEPIATKNTPLLLQFDPNKATLEELIQMGWPKWVAANLIKYRDKGGIYRTAESLKNVYGLTDSMYQIYKPFIMINEEEKEKDTSTATYSNGKPSVLTADLFKINLNSCNSDDLIQLKGIGPTYAKMILEFREKLGGFYSVDQLYDIPYIKPEAIANNLNYFEVDNSFKRMDIQKLSFSKIVNHPYTSYESTKVLSNYFRFRDQKEYLDTFLLKGSINQDTLTKLEPYLRL